MADGSQPQFIDLTEHQANGLRQIHVLFGCPHSVVEIGGGLPGSVKFHKRMSDKRMNRICMKR